ncbi:MAG: Rpn family recombination-promoting nuclease/putative transposase [Bacteroidales bacterium]|nr:Rpn family recombination-promoting nuclease/putative transposase [Bacteroidales bacterium]
MKTSKTNPGVYADPKIDFVFKRIFGSERFKAATIGLLNSLLDNVHVVDVTFLNTELSPETLEQKKCLIDVLCQDKSGNQFIVEMQQAKQVNFMQRMVFYASKLISNQTGLVGNNEYDLHPTYVIAFLNFDLEDIAPGLEKDRCSYHFKNTEVRSGLHLPASPEFHFYCLKNFNKSESEIANEEAYWLYLLTRSCTLEDAPKWAGSKNAFKAYFEASWLPGFSQKEVQLYNEQMINEIDRIGALEYARQKGRAEGHAEGLVEGRAEGLVEGRAEGHAEGLAYGHAEKSIEIAANLKKEGLSVEVIAKCTGLTPEQIVQL